MFFFYIQILRFSSHEFISKTYKF